ncbi:MAG TPA: metallophosphoesterase family protein [Deltaproteobacteria bacterium]|nr:metallophosphoesterase family protein [Deltaproteobacteria bacterium]HPR53729.1 metallophosphoesterase family protein [Deltaproteobacteria bacterium]HXK47595.1 metallophosphoesterase family protein [Deltaproteobacteria bacterium]
MHTGIRGPIGLIADSHGRTDLLMRAILMLKGMGTGSIVHLGDICDSLAPLALEDAVSVLQEHGVQAVRGNNEYAVLTNHQGPRGDSLPAGVMAYLEALPYVIAMDDIRFAHSAPFDWPAATSWPITDNHPLFDLDRIITCRILFRGHSHSPSIVDLDGPGRGKIPAGAGMTMRLLKERRYVITVGALDQSSLALFLPEEEEIRFLQLDGG